MFQANCDFVPSWRMFHIVHYYLTNKWCLYAVPSWSSFFPPEQVSYVVFSLLSCTPSPFPRARSSVFGSRFNSRTGRCSEKSNVVFGCGASGAVTQSGHPIYISSSFIMAHRRSLRLLVLSCHLLEWIIKGWAMSEALLLRVHPSGEAPPLLAAEDSDGPSLVPSDCFDMDSMCLYSVTKINQVFLPCRHLVSCVQEVFFVIFFFFFEFCVNGSIVFTLTTFS